MNTLENETGRMFTREGHKHTKKSLQLVTEAWRDTNEGQKEGDEGPPFPGVVMAGLFEGEAAKPRPCGGKERQEGRACQTGQGGQQP